MSQIHSYLIKDRSRRQQVSIGSRVEILEAYGRDDYRIGFIRSCRIDGRPVEDLIVRLYTKCLRRLPRVSGRVSSVRVDGQDLVIDVDDA